MGKGDQQILEVFKFTSKASAMYSKVLIKNHNADYLCHSEAVVYILSFFISPFSYLTPVEIQLSGISPEF